MFVGLPSFDLPTISSELKDSIRGSVDAALEQEEQRDELRKALEHMQEAGRTLDPQFEVSADTACDTPFHLCIPKKHYDDATPVYAARYRQHTIIGDTRRYGPDDDYDVYCQLVIPDDAELSPRMVIAPSHRVPLGEESTEYVLEGIENIVDPEVAYSPEISPFITSAYVSEKIHHLCHAVTTGELQPSRLRCAVPAMGRKGVAATRYDVAA